jgi:hypothetical protein
MKVNVKLVARVAVATLIGLAGGLSVVGQGRVATGRAEEPDTVTRERDFDARSRDLRRISERDPKLPAPTKAEELLVLARSDFRSLQTVNKALKQATSETGTLAPAFVLTSATEVRKHAESLNAILPLPDRTKGVKRVKPERTMSVAELKAPVLALSNLIQGFIANPCFRKDSLTDTPETRKARLDLETIIDLSRQLQKDSEQLEKANRQGKP